MIEVRDVSKRYGALTAVSHVSFIVRPGEVLGYLGRTVRANPRPSRCSSD